MCLIAFDWQPSAERKLVLISNRDEFYHRPSQTAHYWQDASDIYGGKDLEMGGTWLAVSKKSRFAAVTNFRQPDISKYPLSRGHIPSDFLKSEKNALDWCQSIQDKLNEFSGFNALLFDGENMVYLSNRNGGVAQTLAPGQYGLSNHLLNTSWPKVEKAKQALSENLHETEAEAMHQKLLNAFSNDELAKDSELPDTGVGIELERMLSAMFIQSPSYGTRTTTAISISQDGTIHFSERNYEPSTKDSKSEFSESYSIIESF